MGAISKRLIEKQCGNCKFFIDHRCQNKISEHFLFKKTRNDVCEDFEPTEAMVKKWQSQNK